MWSSSQAALHFSNVFKKNLVLLRTHFPHRSNNGCSAGATHETETQGLCHRWSTRQHGTRRAAEREDEVLQETKVDDKAIWPASVKFEVFEYLSQSPKVKRLPLQSPEIKFESL